MVAQHIETFFFSIAQIEFSGSRGQVDERNIQFFGYRLHLVHVVHRMISRRQLLIFYNTSFCQLAELIAQVVLSTSTNRIARKIHTADRSHEYGIATQVACLFHIFAKKILVGAKRCCATIIGGCCFICFSHLIIIGFQFITIHTITLLIIVRKLNEHVVARLHLLFHALPVCGLLIETLAASSCLTTIIDGDVLEKLLEILRPSTSNRTTFIIGLHRRVADGVYRDSLHLEYAAQRQHQKEKTC